MKLEDLVKETKHKPPRRLLRRVGYDLNHWLDGGWVAFKGSNVEWEAARERHLRLFHDVEIGHDSIPGTSNLTEAQQTAYDMYSGVVSLYVVPDHHGWAPTYGFRRMGDRRLFEEDLQESCKHDGKILRLVKDPYTGVVTDVSTLYDNIPPEFFYDSKKPIDPWELVMERKMKAAYGDFKKVLRQLWPEMAVFLMVEMEKAILKAEAGAKYSNLDRERSIYIKMRKAFAAVKGSQQIYDLYKINHPDVPVFNPDGTHE